MYQVGFMSSPNPTSHCSVIFIPLSSDEHFVDKHRVQLIQRVSNIKGILDELLHENVIHDDSYVKIWALPTSQDMMRELFSGPLASSGGQGKEIFYKILKKHESYLISDLKKKEAPVDTVTAEKVLVETLNDLSSEELDEFKLLTELEKDFPPILRRQLKVANTHDTVELLLETFSDKCVELAQTVLRKMNRTDLVQRLSDSSSGTKGKHSVDERLPALIHKVATMRAVKELLSETLRDLSDEEFTKFKWLLQLTFFQRSLEIISWKQLQCICEADRLVDLIVKICGQQSVEVTKDVFMDMKRTDLVQRLSETSSGLQAVGSSAEAFGVSTMEEEEHCVDEQWPALIQKVETIVAVIELLLETLADLSDLDFEVFKQVFQNQTKVSRDVSDIQWELLLMTDRQDTVFSMVQIYGQQRSVEATKEVLKEIKRTDLLQRLSDSSSGFKKKHSVDEHLPVLIHKVATMRAFKELLLETVEDLRYEELNEFKWLLQFTFFQRSLEVISWTKLLRSFGANELVDVMVEKCGQHSVEVTKEIFTDVKRTDLVKRLPETSSGHQEKHCVEQWPALIQKVETMTSLIELLLETLADLSNKEFKKFKTVLLSETDFDTVSEIIVFNLPEIEDRRVMVFLMVQTEGQQSVETTKKVLKRIRRTDLVWRLLEPSSRYKQRHLDEQQSALIHKVATMTAVKHLLLETFNDLSNWEIDIFKAFLEWIINQNNFKDMGSPFRFTAHRAEMVDLMMQTYGQQSVQLTREVLKKMNRTDLMQRLSKPSSGLKEEHQSELIHKEETMTSTMNHLLKTLEDLSQEEFSEFKCVLQDNILNRGHFIKISRHRIETASRIGMVELMVELYGRLSVEVTRSILMEMGWIGRVKSLTETSSGFKDKHPSEVLHKETTMTSLMEKLLKTLHELSPGEFEKFKHVLQFTKMETGLSKIPGHQMEMADRGEIVKLIVKLYRQQSVEVTIKVLKKIYREDLVEMLSKTSARLKEKQQLKSPQKEATRTSLMEKLLETLEELSFGELEKFKWFLQDMSMEEDLPKISRQTMETAGRHEIVKLIVERYGQQCVVKTREVFMRMKRTDLVEMLSEISSESGYQGSSGRSELEGCVSTTDPSDWTKLEPEVTSTDEDEAPTYSLQSKTGNFECSVSGLRWVCKEKVSFKYQFCSLDVPMERLEMMQYMPAGPLMDITVIAGKFDEVYLPHWICIDDNPTILDKFAVLHIDDSGDAVEKVSEVTSSHVKLSEPVFSLKMVLVKYFGLSVEIYCKVLIYYKMINAASSRMSLTLHVYLIPPDRGLQQHLDKMEISHGYKEIRKPKPEKPLKMHNWFKLTTDLDGADIYPQGEEPQTIMLRYDSTDPNFYEVVKKNPNKDFKLTLTPKNGHQPVWTCEIQEGEYQNTGRSQAAVSTGPCAGATARETVTQSSKPGPSQKKRSLDQQQKAAITADGGKGLLLKMLKDLKTEEFKEFKWHLPYIAESQLENSDRIDIVKLMLQTYTQNSVEVAKEILEEIGRNDLVQMLSDYSAGSEAAGSSS
ncbi:uncharacterized protein LOC121946190 isoform X2 [Plectropomus leopardus]|uniref:uncharacterized protein LOC121946190 isoform X2 n=1 Tax=Plectropomus leopardus TaxID=160734 RepID=UPI001C4AEDE6|nr:uncharacterized protein LOC121946190 isoform X2 [Plectropomus leopardus]